MTPVVVVTVVGGGRTFIHGLWESPCMAYMPIKGDPPHTHVQWGGGCRGDTIRLTFSLVSPPP